MAAPADNDDGRDRLRETAAGLAREHRFGLDQIVLFFRDVITAWLNQHIGVAALHLNLPRGWKTLGEWGGRDKNFSVPWVEFGDRAELVEAIRAHLLGSSGPNVLHLAGWSGVGKTRAVLHAYLGEAGLEGTLYFPTLESFTAWVEDYLARNAGARAAVVIDEVELGDWTELRARMTDLQGRVRVVIVGVGAKGDITPREGVIVVTPPESTGVVAAVIAAADPALSAEQPARLAEWCDHDLRPALLLADANRQDHGLTEQSITSVEVVWRRVLDLFRAEIGDVSAFRDAYELLCAGVDVGNVGEPREEI